MNRQVLSKATIDNIFDNATEQADYVIGLYRMAYPTLWDRIVKVNGFPRISKPTNEYIFNKAIEFDKIHHPSVVAGGCWMNSGFGSDDIPDWYVYPADVSLVE